MTPADAARILEIAVDSTPEILEARFKEVRARLEDKVAKAPTDGLKAKYRESLVEATQAFEILTAAADSTALPVVRKEGGGGKPETGGAASLRSAGDGASGTPSRARESQNRESRTAKPKSSKEFIVVAIIAVAVLGAGGWWVMKTRAEKADRARMADEARVAAERKAAAEMAEAERKAEAEKRLVEERRRVEEGEKARLAAGAKAEQERLDRLLVSLRAELAELRTRWEIFERAERDAERAATEAKSELRSRRDAPAGRQRELDLRAEATSDYARWLADYLLRHPVRTMRSRADELVSARAVEDARPLVEEIKAGMATIETEIRVEADRRLTITGTLELMSDPAGLNWSFEDSFGRSRAGVTPARMTDIGLGPVRVTFSRPGWPEQTRAAEITRDREAKVAADFVSGAVRLESEPAGAEVLKDGKAIGRTPLVISDLQPGSYEWVLRLKGFKTASIRGEVGPRQELHLPTKLERNYPPEIGQPFTIPELELTIVPIGAGTFMMGTAAGGKNKERPVTRVTISCPFWLGRTEVTQAQWRMIMGATQNSRDGESLPVIDVSWQDAMAFCNKLTEREQAAGRLPKGYVYTLPTEAQWEYACRAGTDGDSAGNLEAMAWYNANSGGSMHPVGQKRSNAWGLHDMHGNVWEWCLDRYGAYPGGNVTDPIGALSGSNRVRRGGGWYDFPSDLRSANREEFGPNLRSLNLGFRVALSPVR